MKILIVRTDRLGDVLLSTPTIRAVREHYPDSYISVMVRPYARDCVEGNPYVNEVIIYDKDARHRGIGASFRFAMELRKKKFDLALLLHPTTRTNIIAFLAGIPERVGYDRKSGFLLTKRLPHTKELGLKHELEYTLDIARSIGIQPSSGGMYVPVRRELRDALEVMLAGMGCSSSDTLVAIHPSASCRSKRWSPERFARAADALIDGRGVKVVLVSGPEGKAEAAAVKNSMKNTALDLSGKTTVSELAAVISRCCLFISNDSGPVHMASAVGTPVVAIFGRNDAGLGPPRWGPTRIHDISIHKPTECAPCRAHNCEKNFMCLDAVSVDEVVRHASTILENRKNEDLPSRIKESRR